MLLYGPDGMGKSALLKQAANSAAARAMPGGGDPARAAGRRWADQRTGRPGEAIDALFELQLRLKVNAVSARSYLSNTRPLILLL